MPTNFLACKAIFLSAYKPINYTLLPLVWLSIYNKLRL